MKNIADEFSFLLKPAQHGVGVFAAHAIKKGTYLPLFGDEEAEETASLMRDKKDVPKVFLAYCIMEGKDKVIGPRDFSCMPVGWHLNHSTNPNATHDENYRWYALKNINDGNEITVDYNSLEEPEERKESYYKK